MADAIERARSIPSTKQLADLWAKTGGKAWEPADHRHPFIGMLVDGGWVKYCAMRCGFEAFDTGVNWTDAARAYFAAFAQQAPEGWVLVEKSALKVLLPPGACEKQYLDGWCDGQTYLIGETVGWSAMLDASPSVGEVG